MKTQKEWRPHFPNSLGSLAAIRRETGDRQARITRAHRLIYQALEELRPLVPEEKTDRCPLSLAWGHLVDGAAVVKELQENKYPQGGHEE